MKLRNVYAILLQDYYVTRGSLEVIFDIFIFTLINISLFGFIANYLVQGGNNKYQVQGLLIAVIFWEVIRINQYSITVSSLWNVWSHNLCNMFIAPIRMVEYLCAHIISATIKSMMLISAALVLAKLVFHLNVLSIGIFPILFMYLNMVIFATAVGLVLLGLIFKRGTRIQALAWGSIYIVQPLCAVFFPVSVLPAFLQPVSYIFPITYFFEWIRAIHSGGYYSLIKVMAAFLYNILFLLVCAYIFSLQLAAAKRSGQLVRNDL
jgi:ABC-2 type transport system permease protein